MKIITPKEWRDISADGSAAFKAIPAGHSRKRIKAEAETVLKDIAAITQDRPDAPEEFLIGGDFLVIYRITANLGNKTYPDNYYTYQTEPVTVHHFSEKSLYYGENYPNCIPKAKILCLVSGGRKNG